MTPRGMRSATFLFDQPHLPLGEVRFLLARLIAEGG